MDRNKKTTKEAIRDIIKDIKNLDDDKQILIAVYRVDLLISTMIRQIELGNRDVYER